MSRVDATRFIDFDFLIVLNSLSLGYPFTPLPLYPFTSLPLYPFPSLQPCGSTLDLYLIGRVRCRPEHNVETHSGSLGWKVPTSTVHIV